MDGAEEKIAETNPGKLSMSRHLTFHDLIAYRYGQLPPEEKIKIERHLQGCSQCAAKERVIPTWLQRESAPKQRVRSLCLSPEELSMFLNGELSFLKTRNAEKHLALCDGCREQLADIIRASIAPVNQEEKIQVALHSKLVLADQLRAIEDLTNAQTIPARTTLLNKLRRLFALTSPMKIAWAATLLVVGISVGLRPLRQWQASSHVASGLALMQDTYPIADGAPRPHGFHTGMFSEHHGDTPSEKLLAIERNLQQALSWDINSREAKRAQAQFCYFQKNYPCADSLLQALLRENDQDFATWNDLGVLAAQREDTTAALAAFAKALALQPDYAEAKYNHALLAERPSPN